MLGLRSTPTPASTCGLGLATDFLQVYAKLIDELVANIKVESGPARKACFQSEELSKVLVARNACDHLAQLVDADIAVDHDLGGGSSITAGLDHLRHRK